MSVYDSILCELTCPHCSVTAEFDVEVRFSSANLFLYKVGSRIDETYKPLLQGNSDFEIEGYTDCENCKKDFFTLVSVKNKTIKNVVVDIVRQGYLIMSEQTTLQTKIINWLNLLNSQETIPPEIIALNFGLFETETGYGIYLIGSTEYDEDDSDWACLPCDFEAKNYQLTLKNTKNNDWESFQNLVIDTLNTCLKNPTFSQRMFAKISHITTGFDDGDLEVIK